MSTMPEKTTPILKVNSSIYYFEPQLCWQHSHATTSVYVKDTYKPGVLCCSQNGHSSFLILEHIFTSKRWPTLVAVVL